MKKFFLPVLLFLSLTNFAQQNRYWIKFKDKSNSSFSLSNPQQFLSAEAIERRSKEGIPIDSSDLPLNINYVNGVSPFITGLVHRLKWFNLIVTDIDDPGVIRVDTVEHLSTSNLNDTFSIRIFDTVIIRNKVIVSLSGITYDTIVTVKSDTLFDSIPHPGPIVFTDSIFLSDASTGNKFDSIRVLSFVDSIGEIGTIPPPSFKKEKFEEALPVDQRIVYPNAYGAAYHQTNMLNADLLHQMGYKGEGITIAMMDNGYYNADNIRAFDSVRNQILTTWDFVNNESNVYNDGSHGQNTFSCIGANLPNKMIGTAPGANFYLFTTEDNSAEWVMEEYNWAAAAEFADSAGARLFSTSLGYTTFNNGIGNHSYEDLTGNKTVITRASNIAASKGILVLNSGGNEGANSWHYISAPADGDSVLAVGAVDSAERVTNFSSRGPNASGRIKPDLCAQGTGSAIVLSDGSVGYSSGTSFSCPILVGGIASLWSAFPEKTVTEIRDAVMISADHFWSPDNDRGYGVPNLYTAYLLLKTNYNDKILRVAEDVVVYPNPFTNELNVSFYSYDNMPHQFEIFDMLGRKVYSELIFLRDKTFGIINPCIRSLSPGKYILVLDGNRDRTHLLIKTR